MYRDKFWRNLLSLIAILGLMFGMIPGSLAAAAELDTEDIVDLAIEMKAPQFVAPEEVYVVHVGYTNNGTAASPGDTQVKVTLPAGTSFLYAKDRDGNSMLPDLQDGSVLTWNVGSLIPGICCQRILITIQEDGDTNVNTALVVHGEILSGVVDADPSDNVFDITTKVSDMAYSTKQAHVRRAKPGDEVLYTITLLLQTSSSGTGTNSERSVSLIDVLPDPGQVRFLGWEGENAGTYDPAQNQLNWQGSIKTDEPLTLRYRLGIEGDVPAGTLIRNGAHLSWNGGEMDLEPVDVEVYLDANDHMFGPEGGQWQYQNGLTIDVPPNAVQQKTRFEFKPLFEDTPPADVPAGWKYAHHAFEMKAYCFSELHEFGENIRLTIRYQGEDVQGLDPQTLRLWYRAGPGEPWAMLGEPQMHQNGEISFITSHFTEFLLLGNPYLIRLPFVRR